MTCAPRPHAIGTAIHAALVYFPPLFSEGRPELPEFRHMPALAASWPFEIKVTTIGQGHHLQHREADAQHLARNDPSFFLFSHSTWPIHVEVLYVRPWRAWEGKPNLHNTFTSRLICCCPSSTGLTKIPASLQGEPFGQQAELQGLFCDCAVRGATHLPNTATGNTGSGRCAAAVTATAAAAGAAGVATAAAAATSAATGAPTAAGAAAAAAAAAAAVTAAATATTEAIAASPAVAASAAAAAANTTTFASVAAAAPSTAFFALETPAPSAAAALETPPSSSHWHTTSAAQTQQKFLCAEPANKQKTCLARKFLRNIIPHVESYRERSETQEWARALLPPRPRPAAHGPETSASVGLDLLPADVFRISTGSSPGHAEAEVSGRKSTGSRFGPTEAESPATTGRAWS